MHWVPKSRQEIKSLLRKILFTSGMEDFYIEKKRQTFQRYSIEFKKQVIKEYLEGQSRNTLSKTYNIPKGNISSWVHKVHLQATIAPKKECIGLKVP
jgi:hypothetical protein